SGYTSVTADRALLLPVVNRMKIRAPVIVLGCNRSGTTLLFRNLSFHPPLWSLDTTESPVRRLRYRPSGELGGASGVAAAPVS
ncbi:MAG TPA: hypothetical protein VMM35_11465, partial [Longimicrobiales bacterium]|nr:hypothetical protein [Longimicrobiales bacterium]